MFHFALNLTDYKVWSSSYHSIGGDCSKCTLENNACINQGKHPNFLLTTPVSHLIESDDKTYSKAHKDSIIIYFFPEP